MKTLYIVRHAKSSWAYDVKDIDRPLKKRGSDDASLISNAFKEKNYSIDKDEEFADFSLLCSLISRYFLYFFHEVKDLRM